MPTKAALKDSFLAEKSDDELVDLARRTGNDDGAFEELYRRHENAARNVARHIVRSRHDADDVVNEAFAGVISAINHGAGPRSNFRQYLMACVRNSCKSRRWCGRSISTDPSLLERSGAIFEDPERLSEAGLVANAFSSLSPDWQQTLWLTAVEERPTSEVAEQLGRRPAAVAALAHRAREAFAEAYLAQHQARSTDPTCARISPKLAHYVRGRSGDVDSVLVERHLVDCVACSCAVDELRDLNASLRTLTGPAPLVGMGIAAAGAATMVGFLPLAGASGWSVGAVSGAAVAKIAVLGALLVPAAIVAAKTSPTPVTREKIATAAPATPDRAPVTGKILSAVAAPSPTIATAPVDPMLADMLSVATTETVLGSAQTTAAPSSVVVPPSSVVTPLNTSALPLPVVTVPAPLPALPVTVPPIVPRIGGAGAPGSGGGVNVSVTIPVVTQPINLTVSIPAVSTPPILVPSVPLLPSISTPAITLPAIGIPSVVVPNLGLPLPPISTPPISVPSIPVLPSISLPVVSLPSISVPSLTLPPITLPAITVPNILGGLGLPTISLPKILGS